MPPIAQRLREPAAFVLLAYGALSTLFNTITFLFKPAAGWQQRALDSLEMIGEDVVTTRSAESSRGS